jgi:hypothetical protein
MSFSRGDIVLVDYPFSDVFLAAPGPSNNWIDDESPRSTVSVHSRSAQTTFLSGVTSSICTVLGQSALLFTWPGHQLQITVLPLAKR